MEHSFFQTTIVKSNEKTFLIFFLEKKLASNFIDENILKLINSIFYWQIDDKKKRLYLNVKLNFYWHRAEFFNWID